VRLAARAGIALVVAALLLGLYNDFAIRHRVNESFAHALPSRSGLQVEGCRRYTDLLLEAKNFFLCRVGRDGRTKAHYFLEINGRCWKAWPELGPVAGAPRRLSGCLPVVPA
jgi:hypothetical protein